MCVHGQRQGKGTGKGKDEERTKSASKPNLNVGKKEKQRSEPTRAEEGKQRESQGRKPGTAQRDVRRPMRGIGAQKDCLARDALTVCTPASHVEVLLLRQDIPVPCMV